MISFLKYNWPAFVWAAFILFLCLLPGKDMPSISLWEFDKIGHFSVYVLLSLLMYYGWKKQTAYPFFHRQVFIKILLLTSAYGFAVEILQDIFTADRHFDILDAIANSVGAVAGSLISVKLFKV